MTARRRLAAALLGLAVVMGCSRPVHDARSVLDAEASGTIRFVTAGSIVRVSGSRFALSEQAATIDGDLRVPPGAGPFPLVVLLHGCGGLGNAERGWVTPLGRAGYATFTVDSFTGRGLREVCTSSGTLLSVQRIPDAYGALRTLAGHPRLDAHRVALMGFSHGGGATLASATQWAKDTYVARGAAAFRAFLPFYPPCTYDYPELHRLSAPLRIHIGEADDWTPAVLCRERVEALRRAGFDAGITVYPGAHHSFDNVGRRVTWLPNVDSGAGCHWQAASILGPIVNGRETAGCMRKGATLGWSAGAVDEARRNVLRQLGDLLG